MGRLSSSLAPVRVLSNKQRMKAASRLPVRRQSYLLVFGFLAALLILSHSTLLRLPYYWDEIGQFIPASLDLFESGALIPHSTLPNVHPPGLMVYLTLVWKIFGYSILNTRIAMLLVAAVGALGAFLLAIELGRGTTGAPGFTALALLCVSPLFFSQSVMALLDMPAMAFTVFALLFFLQGKMRSSALVCVALVLVKETGIVAPALFGIWLLRERRVRPALWFLLPIPVLAIWLFALKHATGHWFGSAEFTQYNIWFPLHPVRLGLALLRRTYYLFISSGHLIGTAVLVYAWRRMPVFRSRPWRVAICFAIAHVVAVSLLGGAVLERYVIPVLPILYAAFAIGLLALPTRWRIAATAGLLLCLTAANFVNPPYPFPFENNLEWTAFVGLEQSAARAVDSLPPGPIATAFPFSDALRRRPFGYVTQERRVQQVASFRRTDLRKLQAERPETLVVFTQTWDPLHLLEASFLGRFLHRFYGYEPEATVPEIESLFQLHRQQTWQGRGLEFVLLRR